MMTASTLANRTGLAPTRATRTSRTSPTPSRTPDAVTVTFRRMRFCLDSLPKHWAMDSAGVSHFWNVLSCGFPAAELFFIRAARPFMAEVTDPKLLRELKAFAGQEGHHAHHHKAFNDALKKAGLEIEKYEGWFTTVLDTLWNGSSPKGRLALTAALEHLATVFATQYLEQTRVSRGVADDVDAMWTWHALEELEHKAVCFDLFQAVGGSYSLRVGAMGLAVPLVFTLVLAGQADLIRRDVGMPSVGELVSTWRYFASRRGIFPQAARAIASYFHPDFHPWQEDTSALTEANHPRYQSFSVARAK